MNSDIKYGGLWKINGKSDEFKGELYINSDKGIINLEIYIPESQNSIFSDNILPYDIKYISGKTTSGVSLTLIDCFRGNSNTQLFVKTTVNIGAKFLVNGHAFSDPEDITFNEISFHLTNLFNWSQQTLFNVDISNNTITLDKTHMAETLFKNDEFSIDFSLWCNNFPSYNRNEKYEFLQVSSITIKYNNPQELSVFTDKLNIIKWLIELAVGEKSQITKMFGYSNSFDREIDGKVYPNQFEIFNCYNTDAHDTKRHVWDYLFYMPDIIKNSSLEQWVNKFEDLEPILELYIENISYPQLSVSKKFLNAVQALETYHSRFICDTLKDYKKRVEDLISQRAEQERDFVRAKLYGGNQTDENLNYIILRSRLMDLMIAEFKQYFNTGEIDRFDFIEKVIDTRHYLTHYSKQKKKKSFSGQDLWEAYEILMIMLEYYLLKEIGFEEMFIINKIQEKSGRIHEWRSYRKALNEKNS